MNKDEDLAAKLNGLPSEKFIPKNKAKMLTSVSLLYLKNRISKWLIDESQQADRKELEKSSRW